MIGKIILSSGDEFVMENNGLWTGDDLLTVGFLNLRYHGLEESHGDNAEANIRSAGDQYGADVEIPRKKELATADGVDGTFNPDIRESLAHRIHDLTIRLWENYP